MFFTGWFMLRNTTWKYSFFFNIKKLRATARLFFQTFSDHLFLMDNLFLPNYIYYKWFNIWNSFWITLSFFIIWCISYSILKTFIIFIFWICCCITRSSSVSFEEIKLIAIIKWIFHVSELWRSIIISLK